MSEQQITIDSFSSGKEVSIDDFTKEGPPVPSSMLENRSLQMRAAYVALLGDDPEKFVDTYNNVMREQKEGVDYTTKATIDASKKKSSEGDIKIMADILGNPSTSYEQKMAYIKAYKDGAVNTPENLFVQKSTSLPVKNETPEAERIRISAAEQWSKTHELKRMQQGYKNHHEARRFEEENGTNFFLSFLETMMPGSSAINAIKNTRKYSKEILGKEVSFFKALFLPGSVNKEFADGIKNLSIEKRIEASQKLREMIEANKGLIYTNNNLFQEVQQLDAFIGGEYTETDKWIENVANLLDGFFGAGSLVRGTKQVVKGKVAAKTPPTTPPPTLVNNSTSPIAPASAAVETNPDLARAMLSDSLKQPTDEASQAMFGASKVEAATAHVLPSPARADGVVEPKIINPVGHGIVLDDSIAKIVDDQGAIWWTNREKAFAISAEKGGILHDLQTYSGLTAHDNLSTIAWDGGKVVIRGTYGLPTGGFSKASEAINQVKFSLKEYGVVDENLTLLKKVDGEYVPTSLKEVGEAEGDFLVQVKADYTPRATFDSEGAFGKLDSTTVKWNFFDRMPWFRSKKAGTLANHLVDHASMLDKTLTGAAVVQRDKAIKLDKALLNLHKEFTDVYVKLPDVRKEKLYDEIKWSNAQGVERTDMELVADGFHQTEIDALKKWRKAWDAHYYLENADLVKSLTTKGFKVFDNGQDRFFVKRSAKDRNITKVYDPDNQSIGALNDADLDALYAAGGFYAELRSPIKVGNRVVSHIVVRNNVNSYLRTLNNADEVLSYRKGYYQTTYKAPKFIEKIELDNNGKELYRHAIEVAETSEEAEHVVNRMMTSQGLQGDWKKYFNIRGDKYDGMLDSTATWEVNSSSGRIAQKHRGAPLEGSTSPSGAFNSKYTLDPVESAVRASRSIADRTMMRDMIESLKARAMQQYSEFFPKENGRAAWTSDSSRLLAEGKNTEGSIADARTTVEYIRYLEEGYENGIDHTWKAGMNYLGELFHKAGASTGEKYALKGADVNVVGGLKGGVAQAYLFLNPLRQYLIQAHQSIRMFAVDPVYFSSSLSLDVAKFTNLALNSKALAGASKADRELYDFIKGSGALDSVDRSNLIRGSIEASFDSSNRVVRGVTNVAAVPRKLGYDAGEQTNQLVTLLTVRNKFLKEGKDLSDKAVRDEAYSYAKALTGDMNAAGDMPYNQNWANIVMQFYQVPHKMALQPLNRRIDAMDRAKLFAVDAALWGIPSYALIERFVGKENLPDDPVMRESLLFGFETQILNAAASNLVGKDVHIDFTSLSPSQIDGFAKLATSFWTGGYEEILTKNPVWALTGKEGSKMREAFTKLAKYAGFLDVSEGHDPETITSVLQSIASFSSGWDNLTKAHMIKQLGMIKDKNTGKVFLDDPSWAHVVAQAFGFKSKEEVLYYDFQKAISDDTKSHREEVNKVYKEYFRILVNQKDLTNMSPGISEKVLGAMKNFFNNDPKSMEIVNANLKRDLEGVKDKVFMDAIESAGIPNADKIKQQRENLKLLNDPKLNKGLSIAEDMEKTLDEFRKQK